MRLNDMLPKTYNYRGQDLPINLSYDNVLDVFDVLRNKVLLDIYMGELITTMLFGENVIEPGDYKEVWEEVFETHIKAKQEESVRYDIGGNPMPNPKKNSKKVLIDIEQDASYIFSSFIQAYKINLLKEQQEMHWYEFRALLQGLPENTMMKRIMSIRAWKPGEHDSSEYKEEMRELQDYYRLERKEE